MHGFDEDAPLQNLIQCACESDGSFCEKGRVAQMLETPRNGGAVALIQGKLPVFLKVRSQ